MAQASSSRIAAPLASSLIINSVMFVAFEHAQQQGLSPLAAGVASGVAQAFLTTPMDWIEIQKPTGATARCRRCVRGRWRS